MNIQEQLRKTIQGSGGGSSSSGSSRTPVTQPDTVSSKAYLSILDLLCEGQVQGLVAPQSGSIFIDGTSLTNPDGSVNYEGFEWSFRDGRQDQTVIDGFPSVVTPFNLGTQIKQSTPQTITVNDIDADQVRIIITIPALSSQNEKTGDTTGTTLQYQFLMSVNDGAFQPVNVAGTTSSIVTINDKSRSKYQREHLINLPKPGNSYKIRVQRLTADSTSSYLANDTYLDSYYEIINSKLFYPNSVMMGVKINAEQFSSTPSRSYLIDGMLLRIPSNYDPVSRTYSGVWDGTFKIGFSNNPAWVMFDVLLNKRYGLGEYVNESNVNTGKLYQIARYCDEKVDNGFGGLEPQFTINTCIASRNDAYRVISDIGSVFRGMSYWQGGMVQFTQDSPTDPVYLFNNSNVVDGLFNRVGSARKDRHSVVHVQWNDPDDQFKQKIEYVEDASLIQSLGYRRLDTIAFGCTSRAQAHRVGLWILYTEKVETNITSFEVGLDGLVVMPGDVVKIQDQWKAGKRNGGRLKSATRTGCTLDAPTKVEAGATISIRMPDGKFEERRVNEVGEGLTALTFATQLSALPLQSTMWILSEPSLVPTLGRVMGIAQSDKPGRFVISVVDHNPSKFASINQGLQLEVLPTTLIDPTYSTPSMMKIEEFTYLVSAGQIATRLEVSWEGKSPTYFVQWRMTTATETSGWQNATVTKPTFEVLNVTGGAVYDFKVIAQSVTGKLSSELVGTYVALGTALAPTPPTNLTAVGDFRQIILNWVNSGDIDFDYVEIFENTVDDLTTATYYARTPSNTFTRTGIPGLMQYFYWVRTVNQRGMKSDFNSTAGVSAIAGLIGRTDLDEELSTIIEVIGGDLDGIIEHVDEITDAIDKKYDAITDGLDGRVDDAWALAQAARTGNNIEEMLRDDENVQIKRNIYELGIEVNENISAKITELQEVATSDREAVAHSLETVAARFNANEAALTEEKTARTTADSAQATRLNTLDAKTDATNAAVTTEQKARADADTAQASRLTALDAKTDTTNAGLVSEQKARADADSAQVTDITALKATTAATNASLTEEKTVRADADSAQVVRLNALDVKTNTTNANVTAEQKARADADTALASDITILRASVTSGDNALDAKILAEQTARANGDEAVAATVTALKATVTNNNTTLSGAITSEQTARATADSALGQRIDTIVATNGTINAAVKVETTARVDADGALSTRIDQLIASTGSNLSAAIQTEQTARAGADTALGTRIDTVQATANGASTAVQTTSSALATLDGKLTSSWTVKVQTASNGQTYVAGMGVGIQNTAQGITQSQILLQADRVVMINPANNSTVVPFQLVGGVIYLTSAVIQNGTIDFLKISDTMQSSNYVAGSQGWRFAKNGTIELNGYGSGLRRQMAPNYDRYWDTGTGVLVIEIGELT